MQIQKKLQTTVILPKLSDHKLETKKATLNEQFIKNNSNDSKLKP